MRGWRSKLIFMFILYFAGFATAVYMLAPKPKSEQNNGQDIIQTKFARFDSQEFITSFNSGLHKGVDLGKEAAVHLSKYIKEKTNDSEVINTSKRDSST